MKQVSVGLTGSIGGGKTTASEALRKLGADVASGDDFGREAINDTVIRAAIVTHLGGEVVDADGSLNRRAIAARVFADASLSKWLTNLTFPAIHERWHRFKSLSNRSVVVFDAALIFEWKIEREFDVLLCVTSSREIARHRTAGRFSSEDFDRRWSVQTEIRTKMAGSQFVIENNGSVSELHAEIQRIWKNHIQPLVR